MKIFWLTPGQFLTAIILGLLSGFILTAVTVPHLVETPIQIITRVPTPPPVVITQIPPEQNNTPIWRNTSYFTFRTSADIDGQLTPSAALLSSMLTFMIQITPIMVLLMIISILMSIFKRGPI